jgi:ferredoxin-nitrite reductase
MSETNGFTDEQKSFLQGFAMGSDVARAVKGLPIVAGSGANGTGSVVQLGPAGAKVEPAPTLPTGPERLQAEAQNRVIAQGKTLCREEKSKQAKDPLTIWDEIQDNGRAGVFPKDTDVFLYKYSGLFFVAPAQNSFMCRLRFPGGEVRSWQLRGIADLARTHGGGHADATTRANLQIREIGASSAPAILTGLAELGILNKGAGADNIRNVTATPTSGVDPQELIETLPLAKQMHHYILNHREMYGLPRKFNIAFEGGGTVSSLDDTNDIGFNAVRIDESNASSDLPAGVYFRLSLGGITGHKDFARDTGVLLRPEECVPVAAAIVRVFIREGDRTDRRKARLKYVLDSFGFPKFLEEVEKELGSSFRRVDLDRCEPPVPNNRWGHVGFHPQKQPGFVYVGVVLPVGRMTCDQLVGLAEIAERYGSGTIRMTVWQNLLITDIAERNVEAVKQAIEQLGLGWNASSVRSGLVACTGNAGCKFAGADTKSHAMSLANYLEERIEIDQPINIHVTGCQNSCAQHYIGDIGLEGTKVEVDEELVEGYHLCVGGGWGLERGVGRRLAESMPFPDIPPTVERLLRHYLAHRESPGESFAAFARKQSIEDLKVVALPSRSLMTSNA